MDSGKCFSRIFHSCMIFLGDPPEALAKGSLPFFLGRFELTKWWSESSEMTSNRWKEKFSSISPLGRVIGVSVSSIFCSLRINECGRLLRREQKGAKFWDNNTATYGLILRGRKDSIRNNRR